MAREIHKPKTDFTDLQKYAQTLAENFMKTPGFTTLEEPAIIREGISHGETDNNSKGELPMKEKEPIDIHSKREKLESLPLKEERPDKPWPRSRIYDFSSDRDMLEEISVKMESMGKKQLDQLQTEAARILTESRRDQIEESQTWFETAALPVLKNFAETFSASLEISNEDETMILVTFQNKCGYDLAEDDRHMRMLFGLSNHVSIEKNGDNIMLVLAFDCLDMK